MGISVPGISFYLCNGNPVAWEVIMSYICNRTPYTVGGSLHNEMQLEFLVDMYDLTCIGMHMV